MNQTQTTTSNVLRKLIAFTLLIAGCVFAFRAASSGASAIVEAPSTQPIETQKLATQSSLVTQNIEDIRLGQRVVGTNPLRQQTQTAADIDPATWRAVRLTMHEADVQYDLAFLRPVSWLEATGAKVGGSIHLELHEMGLDGPAEVMAIDPCPEIEPDDGTGRNVVTGTMAHPGANILYLDITGLDEPLGVTDTHPIWSETRRNFVVAGQLEIGEQFRTLTGEPTTLKKIHPHRGPPETVYNLEVDGEHVYSIGGNGLLVHNDCPIVIGENMDRVAAFVAKNGGQAYRPWKNVPFDKALGLARNERWLKDQMRAGRQIIDIGPDFARRRIKGPSQFYELERRLLRQGSYDNYTKVFDRVFGGVRGLD